MIGAGRVTVGVLSSILIVFILETGHLPVIRRLDERMRAHRERDGPSG